MAGVVIDSYMESDYDSDGKFYSSTYYVTKAYKQGTFTNSVTICKEDIPEKEEDINNVIGYEFAERKCDIQLMGIKYHYYEQRYIEAKHLHKTAIAKFGDNNETVDFLYHQMNLAKRDYENIYKQYKYMRDGFREYTTRVNNKHKELLQRSAS